MKILLRYVPILAGLFACAIVSVIGVMLSMNDSSGLVVKVMAIVALIVGFVVLQLVKNWLAKRASQESK
jgi:uncharacterized membrane protein (UPF0136 family)